MYSIAVVIDDKVFFSGDTKYDSRLIPDTKPKSGFRTYFHDVQFFTGGIHASLTELSQLPKHVKQRTFLTHYSDNYKEFEEQAQKNGFAGFAQQGCVYEW
jgi:ribonuclease BN (tRNA processing enzyme)